MTRLLLLALLLCAPALAADEGHKIDFTVALDTEEPTVDPGLCPLDTATSKRPCETPLTLGRAIYYSLRINDQGITFDESVRRDELARKVRDAKDLTLFTSDLDLIKRQLPKVWPPAVVGAAARLLAAK
jgi:hypothetical protein